MPSPTRRMLVVLLCVVVVGIVLVTLLLPSRAASGPSDVRPLPAGAAARTEPAKASASTQPGTGPVPGADTGQMAAALKQTQDEIVDMAWNSMATDVVFSQGLEPIRSAVTRLPWTGRQLLTESQAASLEARLAGVLECYGTNNLQGYFDMLKRAGETVAPDLQQQNRESLIKREVAAEMVPADPWDAYSLYWRKSGRTTLWHGLCMKQSKVVVREVQEVPSSAPGAPEFQFIRRAIVTFRHVGVPPVSMPQALESKGKVVIAEGTFFVSHAGEKDGIVVPYVMRFWYDPQSDLWRPASMACFPNRFDEWLCRPVF